MRRLLAAAASAAVLGSALAIPGRADAHTRWHWRHWHAPRCSTVQSSGKLTFTTDEGRTITPTAGHPATTQSLTGLATLATPDHVLGVDAHGRLFLSRDAGCMWVLFGRLDRYTNAPQVAAARDGSAYVWGHDTNLYRVRGTHVTALPALPAGMVDLAVDPHRAAHLRAVLDDGRALESWNGGHDFHAAGRADEPYRYDAATDPRDFRHLVVGTSGAGVLTSRNGGRTWHKARGIAHGRANVYSVAFSPADPSVVYAEGMNMAEHDAGSPDQGRHIYRSTNGGRTFHVIVDDVPGAIVLPNGSLLAPDPRHRSVLYFVFGEHFGGFGTRIYRYSSRTHRVTWTSNSYDGIRAIAFNPRYPNVMYLGTETVRGW